MPTSDADLDDQLRAAMKTLDDEVPSGYFEALPDLTLARLEGTPMQQGTQGTTDKTASAVPPSAEGNTEDSGLHDIRNLAQSTKQRLSSRRVGTIPPVSEDDLIASSSAGFKAVALPQPAKMVALPELAELPSKKEVLAKEKAAAKAEKAAAKVAAVEAAAPVAAAVAAPVEAAPAVSPRQPAFSLPSAQKQKKSKTGVIAIVGIGLAAAAGAAIFVATQKKSDQAAAPAAVAQNTAPAATPTGMVGGAAGAGSAAVSADVQKAQDEVARAEADADKAKAELAAAQAAAPPPTETKTDVPVKAAPKTTKGGGHGKEKVETTPVKTDETKAPDKGKDVSKKDGAKAGSGEGEPDFNDLLKEAGVKDPQKKAPVLEKKELTGTDFMNAMGAVKSKALACYKGTQGTATVKMTIAPSGQIAKVTVSGPFATTPEGACVVAAVKSASFPAWDGHPASFTYPILLSE